MILLPYGVQSSRRHYPVVNWVLIASITAVFLALAAGWLPKAAVRAMVLDGWNPAGLLGHLWLHADLAHLAGNMLFLWVFGNAVCGRVRNGLYAAVFPALGLLAAAGHLAGHGGKAVGASGAINGVVGMFLVLYPTDKIDCFYNFAWKFGTLPIRGFWVILLWLAFDILGALMGQGRVAYHAHLGGFAGGVLMASALCRANRVELEPYDRTLLDILGWSRRPEPAASSASPSGVRVWLAEPFGSPAPGHVRFPCRCGRSLETLSAHAGQVTQCPACKDPVQVPDG